MSDPIQPISLQDALAMAMQIPDTVVPVGPVQAKRRAEAVEITRTATGWQIAMPRSGKVEIDASVFAEQLAPLKYDAAALAGVVLDIPLADGRTFQIPAILAHAILGWLYVRLESGIVP